MENHVPAEYLPLLSHPTLKRHVKFTRTGDLIKARLCHDLFALPYDRKDISKVPFNRIYKREKLLLVDNPGKRMRVERQSLTCDMKKVVDDGEIVRRGVERVKRIYANGNIPQLDREYDEKKRDRCIKIMDTLPKTHPIRNTRRFPKLTKTSKRDNRLIEELIQHEEDKMIVLRLDNWDNTKMRSVERMRQ